ncbi:MAG: hypothetical protein JWP29_5613, partial [Rhodoferax sp.]|nr:hypothetical protein [Rhodoferax sp.]
MGGAQRLLSGLLDPHIRVDGIRLREPECRSNLAYLQKKRLAPKDSVTRTTS